MVKVSRWLPMTGFILDFVTQKRSGSHDNAKTMVGYGLVRVMLLNATLNNISVISWRLVLLVEETGVPGENHRPVANH